MKRFLNALYFLCGLGLHFLEFVAGLFVAECPQCHNMTLETIYPQSFFDGTGYPFIPAYSSPLLKCHNPLCGYSKTYTIYPDSR